LPGSGNVAAVAAEVQRLQAMTEDPDAAHLGLGAELRALALITVGITELWAAHLAALSHAGTLRLTVPSHPAQVPDETTDRRHRRRATTRAKHPNLHRYPATRA
jgi:hypothetical protein